MGVKEPSKLVNSAGEGDAREGEGGKIFEVRLLGGFQCKHADDAGLPKKARALLAYLAMMPGRPIPREQLADLLWSSSGPEQARHSLRQSLVAVRRVFEHSTGKPITTIGPDVMLEPTDALEVDAHRFEALARSDALADLANAGELYRGCFLANFDISSEPFMAWVQLERARLESIANQVLRRLAEALSTGGDHNGAVAAAQRLVALDPLNEDANRLLMELYAFAGRRVEAIRQFATLSDNLRRELNVAPDKRTLALAHAIRADALAPGLSDGTDAPAGSIEGTLVDAELTVFAPLERLTPVPGDEKDAAANMPVAVLPAESVMAGGDTGNARALQVLAVETRRHALPLRPRMPRLVRAAAALLLVAVCVTVAGAGIWHYSLLRFDGEWSVQLVCESDKNARGYSYHFSAQVKDGILHGERGTAGAPGWFAIDGPIRSDGGATLHGNGLTNDPANTYFSVKNGTPYSYTIDAHFDQHHGAGKRLELRACSVNFVKV